MPEVQLRLFPAPKPLVERLGAEFFKRIPARPGVYLMSGSDGRLLYVGKAGNLRQRLNSYKNLQPERASRKTIRLVHEIRAITYELCGSPGAALLRENELLRLHKPKYNRLNTHPEHYLFVGLRADAGGIQLRLTKTATAFDGERLYGAFKGAWQVRAAKAALLRLAWSVAHQPQSLFDLPAKLYQERPPEQCRLELPRLTTEQTAPLLEEFLDGVSDALVQHLSAALADATKEISLRHAWEQDLETLRNFFAAGPARNQRLRQRGELEQGPIPQADLDDLLALD